MADDLGDKTEPPTPRRRRESRDRGQVAKSQELSAAVLLLTTFIALKVFGGNLWQTLSAVMHKSLLIKTQLHANDLILFGKKVLGETALAVLPLFITLFVVALLVMYLQVGWLFTLTPVTPTLSKLNPLTGIKRIFSPQSLIKFAQNLVKLSLVVVIIWTIPAATMGQILLAHTLDHQSIFFMAASLVFDVGVRLALALLVLSILDYFYERYRHEKQLKMTKQEVKEEMKRMDGDPVMKRRRREVQLRLAMERLKSTVPEADVVVTNPTHYAIAIRYDTETMASPKVVAKGVDYLAQRIREIAASAGVPIVERPSLARSLYSDVEVGREIPERLFRAVAEVLAYVYELAGQRMGPVPVSAN